MNIKVVHQDKTGRRLRFDVIKSDGSLRGTEFQPLPESQAKRVYITQAQGEIGDEIAIFGDEELLWEGNKLTWEGNDITVDNDKAEKTYPVKDLEVLPVTPADQITAKTKPVKPPIPEYIKIYLARISPEFVNKTQKYLAEKMGIPDWKISRALSAVKKYQSEIGLPITSIVKSREIPTDPAKIDLGERSDKRTIRQRPQKSINDDSWADE